MEEFESAKAQRLFLWTLLDNIDTLDDAWRRDENGAEVVVLAVRCVNAHDRCDGGPCPYCETVMPPRDANTGRFVSPPPPTVGET